MADKTQEELIDKLFEDYTGPESFWGEGGLFSRLKKKIIERALDAEMDNHIGYSKHDPKGKNSGNSSNDKNKKTIVIDSVITCQKKSSDPTSNWSETWFNHNRDGALLVKIWLEYLGRQKETTSYQTIFIIVSTLLDQTFRLPTTLRPRPGSSLTPFDSIRQ